MDDEVVKRIREIFEGRNNMETIEAFKEIHPAEAGSIIQQITEGVDKGFTGQMAAHPDFRGGLAVAIRISNKRRKNINKKRGNLGLPPMEKRHELEARRLDD